MALLGDPEGIAELKRMSDERREYLKFVMQEARTVFERMCEFKSADGREWRLRYDDHSQDYSVEPA